jgi:hypothetical protein
VSKATLILRRNLTPTILNIVVVSKSLTNENIFDDVLRQRFKTTAMYDMVGVTYLLMKNQAVLDTFNDRESGIFNFLIESLACHSSIKLPSGYYYII